MEKVAVDPQIGADPEMFLWDNEDEKVVPCVGILPGTKQNPAPLHPEYPGYCVQEDNVMIEYNIPPQRSAGDYYYAINTAQNLIRRKLEQMYGEKYTLLHARDRCVSHEFSAAALASPQAQEIGCEPDFDAYTGGTQRIYRGVLGNTRSCGGHIHLGGNFQCPDFVAALFADVYIGWYGGAVHNNYLITEAPRREWYGMPGIYRPKPYGIEYRSPSNNWTIGDRPEQVGKYALELCRWLTKADPRLIVAAFKSTDWTTIRGEHFDLFADKYAQTPTMDEAVNNWQTKYGLGA